MYKGRITTETKVEGGAIVPFSTVFNTNANTIANGDGSVSVRKRGYYAIDAVIVAADITDPLMAQLYVNDTPIPEAISEIAVGSVAEDIILPLNIQDIEKIVPDMLPNLARFSVRLTAAATIKKAVLTITEIR